MTQGTSRKHVPASCLLTRSLLVMVVMMMSGLRNLGQCSQLPQAFVANLTSSALQVKFIYPASTNASQIVFSYYWKDLHYLVTAPVNENNISHHNNSSKVYVQWLCGLADRHYYTICARAVTADGRNLTQQACVSMRTLEKAQGDSGIDIRGVVLVLGMGVIIVLLLLCGIGYEKVLLNCPMRVHSCVEHCWSQCCCCKRTNRTSKVHPTETSSPPPAPLPPAPDTQLSIHSFHSSLHLA